MRLVKKTYSGCRLIWLAALIVLISAGCSSQQRRLELDDFRIEVNTYSTSWRPAQFLEIRGDGRSKYMMIPPGMDQKPVRKNFQLSRRQVNKIRKKIEKVAFFELEPEYLEKRFSEGWHIEITVVSAPQKHTVHVLETYVKPIIDILKTINSVTPLPDHMKFLRYAIF